MAKGKCKCGGHGHNGGCKCHDEVENVGYNKFFDFPLTRPHTGMLFGNGTMGVMVYGEKNIVKVCVSRSDIWDHNGGVEWGDQSFEKICDVLERKDEETLNKLFPAGGRQTTIIPVGRIEFELPEGYRLVQGVISLNAGFAKLFFFDKNENIVEALLAHSVEDNGFIISFSKKVQVKGRSVPAWESIQESLEERGFAPVEKKDAKTGKKGYWYQKLPVDPGYACAWEIVGAEIKIAVERDSEDASATALAVTLLEKLNFQDVFLKSHRFWAAKFEEIPCIEIPDNDLSQLYYYGMYKFIIATCMSKVACGLQGPWIEDYQLPPWASDYHFNINVQMCYWPAYQSGLYNALLPVFNMLDSWKPRLRHNAKQFINIDNGYMLPHAVDDNGKCMGNFWTGMLDHGCTMWMATLMYRYFDYSGDAEFMKATGYDFMVGAMNVFLAMLKEEKDGSLSLPFGVSPEFGGASMNAYGKNPSFQLAVAHRLAMDLIAAAKELKKKPDPRWADMIARLPKASIFNHPNGSKQIGLWDGKNLDVSHRHHSHLGAIAPFDTIDCEDPAWRKIVNDSITNWIYWGPSMWTGWCITWASMLHTHMGNGDMSAMYLKIFNDVFTNEGGGTLHDTFAAGISLFGMSVLPDEAEKARFAKRPEIMQLDGGMGAVAALLEMFVVEKNDVVHIFRGCPKKWSSCGFEKVRTKHGYIVSAARVQYDCIAFILDTDQEKPKPIKIANPFKDKSAKVIAVDVETSELLGVFSGDVFKIKNLVTAGKSVLFHIEK
ncbi:MAG: hypothetical protein II332_01325 [Kiritimatiellae bacterium]|nr:hypothetical protein [Kiritimatiellia bacterium]